MPSNSSESLDEEIAANIQKHKSELTPDAVQRAKIAQRLAQPERGQEDGSAPAVLVAALHDDDTQQAVANALLDSRVFLPIVIGQECEDGQLAVFSQDSATGLDAFADYESLHSAYPGARPQAISGINAARRALTEGGCLRVNGVVLPTVACVAIAAGDRWLAAWNDEEFKRQISDVLAELELVFLGAEPDPDGTTCLSLAALPNQRLAVVRAIEQLNEMETVAARCGKVRMVLVSAAKA